MTYGFRRLEEAGYTRRSAYASVRNPERDRFVYQESQYKGMDLLGMGVAAFSYIQGGHQQNATSLRRYMAGMAEGGLPLGRAHKLDIEEQCVREFVLQLKLGGAEEEYFRAKFDTDINEKFAKPLSIFRAEEWIEEEEEEEEEEDGDVTLTPEGLLHVDSMIPEFYSAEHQGTRYS